MLFWTMIALVTAATTLAVLRPLMRQYASVVSARSRDAAVYRDQLAELARDRARGLIGDAEAAAARTEIGRRLIDADVAAANERTTGRSWAKGVAVVVVVAIPALVLGLYLTFGSPDRPDAPLALRLAEKPAETDIASMVARVERHLETHPEDISGWRVLAPIYMRSGRYQAAADAYGRVVAAGGATPDETEGYGLALVAEAGGVVSAKAEGLFRSLVETHPERSSAHYYLAEALSQSGANREALHEIDEAIRLSPADAPWLTAVRAKREKLLMALGDPADTPEPTTLPPVTATLPGPTAADVNAAAGMSTGDRSAMIAGMVDNLANRLATDPHDKAGWLRLIRSYAVLGRMDDARKAVASARAAFAGDAGAIAEIDGAAAENGVSGQ